MRVGLYAEGERDGDGDPDPDPDAAWTGCGSGEAGRANIAGGARKEREGAKERGSGSGSVKPLLFSLIIDIEGGGTEMESVSRSVRISKPCYPSKPRRTYHSLSDLLFYQSFNHLPDTRKRRPAQADNSV